MKNTLVTLFLVTTLLSCSKPIADFTIQSDSLSAPTVVNFTNKSVGAENYSWSIDGAVMTDSTNLEHLFLSSGRYAIELSAITGQKQNRLTKEVIIDAPKECLVYMQTNLGDLIFSLSELTPNHRDNFLKLVDESFYEGVLFHRVINGFMIQGGNGRTRQGKSKKEAEYLIDQEIDNTLVHTQGALAAARMPDDVNPSKASSGSQFYIVSGRAITEESLENMEAGKLFEYTKDQKEAYVSEGGAPQLDGEYTVFGRLLKGYDTLNKISKVKTDNRDKPIEDVVILKVFSIN